MLKENIIYLWNVRGTVNRFTQRNLLIAYRIEVVTGDEARISVNMAKSISWCHTRYGYIKTCLKIGIVIRKINSIITLMILLTEIRMTFVTDYKILLNNR